MSIATTRSIRPTRRRRRKSGSSLKEGVRADIQAANTHYAQYEGKVQDAATKVNDTYLKAFSEEAGVQSYGEAGGSSHRVVPGEKVGQNEKMSLTNAVVFRTRGASTAAAAARSPACMQVPISVVVILPMPR